MTPSLHISVADLGTNTVKILHAVHHPDGSIEHVEHVSNTIRLGAGIEATGVVDPGRISSCIAFLKEQEAHGRQLGSTHFIGVATEALRVAANGNDLLNAIASESSWDIRLISGAEEASLTFTGLRDQVPHGVPSAIVDIGGGSTEVIVVQDMQVTWQRSLRIGSGRLADRFFSADPPGMEACALAFSDALEALAPLSDIPIQLEAILFSGGNGVFLQSLIEGLFAGEPLTINTTERLLQRLASTPASETAERLGIMLERARVLPAGVAIALAALSKTRAPSARGVYSGIQLGLISEYIASQR